MCGRVVQLIDREQLSREYGVKKFADIQEYARYNVSPTTRICGIIEDPNGDREARMMRWGLLPPRIGDPKDFKFATFNARDDKILMSRMYAPAMKKHRCIIPVAGYYEWKKLNAKDKQPYYFHAAHAELIALAGLWGETVLDGGEVITTCTIITTHPNEVTKDYHDRMPMIVTPDEQEQWLAPDTPLEMVTSMLHPCDRSYLDIYAVDKAVGRAGYEDPHLIDRVAA
ncbi:MAG: SOS response-associated peptidase [Bacteroidetes bacterium]|nr:SOS response-associated peptidase [Bacteroidota bacterium]